MFFIMGITQGRKDFDFHQMITCDRCGSYGRYSVYMVYTVLSLFFIPTIKWGKRYYVETSCCHSTYELNPEIGRAIARGESVVIRNEDIIPVDYRGGYRTIKRCTTCGFETDEDYDFCPKCGGRL